MTRSTTSAKDRDDQSSKPKNNSSDHSPPKKSPDKSRTLTERRRVPRLTKPKTNRLASLKKARAVKVLKNAKATKAAANREPIRIPANKETKVYVGNLLPTTKKSEIEKEFKDFGRIRDVWMAENPPGFAFVNFVFSRDAHKVVRDMDGKHVLGTRLRVEIAKSLGPKPREHSSSVARPRSRERKLSTGDGPRERRISARPARLRRDSGAAADDHRNRDRRIQQGNTLGQPARRGRKRKGRRAAKRRLGRLRTQAQSVQREEPKPPSPVDFFATSEFRLGSPPRKTSGVDLPPPPPLLPMPPVDLYDVFDSRFRNMEYRRYRNDPSYRNWRGSPPAAIREVSSYYVRSPSPRAVPCTPPSLSYYNSRSRRRYTG